MIIYTSREGYLWENEETGKQYSLYEMVCLGGKATSDMVAIWDHDNDENIFVNWFMGASCMDAKELDKTVAHYVAEYEAKKEAQKKERLGINYKLSKVGVKAWGCDVVDDICDKGICEPYIISHGNRYIELPDLAEIHNELEDFLATAEEIANEEV